MFQTSVHSWNTPPLLKSNLVTNLGEVVIKKGVSWQESSANCIMQQSDFISASLLVFTKDIK